jgi:Short C-terminal domain
MTAVAVLAMIASAVGFTVALVLNTFVFDEYDAYGEVPIPGSSSVDLPAGDVTVTFHTVLIGGSGTGLPVPPLKSRITGPDGIEPQLSEDYGATTTVNNDARVRIGYLRVPVDGTYRVRLDGNVGAYLNPTLAFGHGSRYGSLPWIMAVVFGIALVDLIVARIWASRVGRRSETMPSHPGGDHPPWPPPRSASAPSDKGVRMAQLETLARLRDSGALTDAEYEAEKKRVLDGF